MTIGWGPDRLTAGQRRDLVEIVEGRHSKEAILITSPLPVAARHDVIDESTFADAIFDRLLHIANGPEPDGHSICRSIDRANEVDGERRA